MLDKWETGNVDILRKRCTLKKDIDIDNKKKKNKKYYLNKSEYTKR